MNIEAFYSLSYGLYVVGTASKGKKNGYVANTAFQVTATPEQIAISCNKDNLSEQMIDESGYFSLSVLEKDASKEIINRFGYKSGKTLDKFEGTKYFETNNGVPVVTEECVAWFECKVEQKVDVGTHIIFIGRVLEGEYLDENKESLTYAYYRQVRHGLSPKNSPTYVDKSLLPEKGKKEEKAEEEPAEKPKGKPMQKWECIVCGHIYDPAVGDPEQNIPPGTAFEDLPDDWVCPDCGAEKEDFEPI